MQKKSGWGLLFLAGIGLGTILPLAVFTVSAQTTGAPKLLSVTTSSKNLYSNAIAYQGDTVFVYMTADQSLRPPVVTIMGEAASVKRAGEPCMIPFPFFGRCLYPMGGYFKTDPATKWIAKKIILQQYPEGMAFTFSIAPIVATSTGKSSGTTVTTPTSGSLVTFSKSLSPAYCLWKQQFSGGPYIVADYQWIRDPNCAPTAHIYSFTATTPGGSYNASVRTNDRVSTYKDCGFANFDCDWRLSVQKRSATTSSGSLPPYIKPGENLTLSWDCQPYQLMAWLACDYNWWGASGTDCSATARKFTYSSRSKGEGFETGGALRGSVLLQPVDTKKYALSCGDHGYALPEILVSIDNPQGTISASPSKINPGGSTKVYWTATNVKDNSCNVTASTGAVVGSANTNKSPTEGVSSGPLPGSASPVIFTLTCMRYTDQPISWKSNPVDVAGSCATVYDANNQDQCSFNSTSPILEGGKVDLKWYCPASNQSYKIESSKDGGTTWSSVKSGNTPNGGGERTETVKDGDGPLDTTAYRLTCTSSTGGNSMGTSSTVVSHPSLTISASPSSLELGNSTNLRWSAQNVNQNSCGVNVGGTLTALATGNLNSLGFLVKPAALPASYTLTCKTPASNKSRTPHPTAVASVYEPGMEPTLDARVDPVQVRKNANTKLFWDGTNLPSSCSLSSRPLIVGLPSTVASTPTGNSIGVTIGPVAQATILTLTCGPASDSVTAGLLPVFQEI